MTFTNQLPHGIHAVENDDEARSSQQQTQSDSQALPPREDKTYRERRHEGGRGRRALLRLF